MFGRSKKKSQPPEVKPKPTVTRQSFPCTKTPTDTKQRKSASDIGAKEAETDSNTIPTSKQPVDEDAYLVPNRVEVGSDEYVKVKTENQTPNEIITKKSKDEVLVNASVSSDVQHLHIHIHIPPSQTDDNKTKQLKVIVERSSKEEEPPTLPPRPASAVAPPSPMPPPRSYKDRDSIPKSEQETQKESEESSAASEDESEVDVKSTERQVSEDQESYEEVHYGGSEDKDDGNQVSVRSAASHKEETSPRETEVQSKEDHHPWLFQHTESARVEELLKTDKDGRFVVIQEDEEVMPFTPYTLVVVQNGQLKRVPIMKKETAGREKYSIATSKDKKSIDDLVTYFQSHEIRGLKLKLKPPE